MCLHLYCVLWTKFLLLVYYLSPDTHRAQEILRHAVAQGGAVNIRVSSAVAHATTTTNLLTSVSSSPSSSLLESSSSPSSSSDEQPLVKKPPELPPHRKRTPPPLPPKPKLPPDLETMLIRANYEASLDYTPDEALLGRESQGAGADLLYGSIRRPGRKLTIDLLKRFVFSGGGGCLVFFFCFFFRLGGFLLGVHHAHPLGLIRWSGDLALLGLACESDEHAQHERGAPPNTWCDSVISVSMVFLGLKTSRGCFVIFFVPVNLCQFS